MLNGASPLLIFQFKENPAVQTKLFNALKVPIKSEFAGLISGIPIPLYLDENITGLFVDSESKNLDLETTIEPRLDYTQPYIYQRPVNSSITVNLNANKDSILLPALLALADLIIPRLTSATYKISYFNGATSIINGLLQGLSTSEGANDDLIRIVLQIQKEDSRPVQTPSPSLENVGGDLKSPTGVKPK